MIEIPNLNGLGREIDINALTGVLTEIVEAVSNSGGDGDGNVDGGTL